MKTRHTIAFALISGLVTLSASAATGFGSRKNPPTATPPTPASQPVAQTQLTPSKPETLAPVSETIAVNAAPPAIDGSEWLRVPFDKAENEVLELFQRDLPKLEDIAQDVTVYEVRASGQLPQDYRRNLRAKVEHVLLNSKRLRLKLCSTCEEARIFKNDQGAVKFESFSSDVARPMKIASELGVGHLIYAEMSYTPEDLQMRVRMVDAMSGQLRWTKDYSTADVIKTRENFSDSDSGRLGHGDSLAHVLIGEVAFTMVLSPGFGMFPTISSGSGSGTTIYPSFDLFVGEKFDRGRKVFGFLFGGIFTMGDTNANNGGGKPLPWGMRIAPRFRYVFNPYNMTSARYSVAAEMGGFISTGLATAYVGLGPEISMINRFSVSLTPLYFLSATVKSTEVFNEGNNGAFTNAGSTEGGKFGGLGALMKVSINW